MNDQAPNPSGHTGAEEAEQVEREVRIRWPLTAEITYANQVLSQFQEESFIVSFGVVQPLNEYLISREEFEQLTHIPVHLIARMLFTPKMMRETIETLTDNYRRWEARYGAQAGNVEGEQRGRPAAE